MASGKQLSFQYGEVSPSLRYKSDVVSYSQGLAKLRNMYVRNTGGFSNRPGFEFVKIALTQKEIPAPGGLPGIRGFTFWSPTAAAWRTIEYGRYTDDDVITGLKRWGFSVQGATPQLFIGSGRITGPTADKVKFTPLKDGLFVTPPNTATTSSGQNLGITYETESIDADFGAKPLGTILAAGSTIGFAGIAPFRPAVYIITVTLDDGTEKFVFKVFNVGSNTDGTGSLYYPHAQLQVNVNINFDSTKPMVARIRTVNIYKGLGPGQVNIQYRLAGRVPFSTADYNVKFTDFGVEDASITPPSDGFGILNFFDDSTNSPTIKGAYTAAYYQQRLFLGMIPGTSSSIKSGDILASKLGAPEQLSAPSIYSNNGAFQFSIPITDGTPVIASLAMERYIGFTGGGVYVARGGEQGVVTPTQINPLNVSEEGCSLTVEPKMVGRQGYYINNSHTKLMAISFSFDGNLEVAEVSQYSNHLLLKDVIQIEVLKGEENCVYLLMRNGTLVRATVAQDVQGFSTIDTPNGYIESIYRGKERKKYIKNAVDQATGGIYHDVLMAYVIRQNLRTLERLNVRDDLNDEGFNFLDCSSYFGWRLSEYGNFGYLRNAAPQMSTYYDFDPATMINIGPTPGTWTAGETIYIRSTSSLVQGLSNWVLHFYYDVDGKTQTLEYKIDYDSEIIVVDPSNPAFTFQYSGFFESDVPASLRDVNSQDISELEQIKRLTRWCPAINFLDSALAPNIGVLVNEVDPTEYPSYPFGIFADGQVISSPLNINRVQDNIFLEFDDEQEIYLVHLPAYYSYGVIGTPIESEAETLDLEVSDQRTLTDARKLINSLGIALNETRGGFLGIPGQTLDNMEELITREQGDIGVGDVNFNGQRVVSIPTTWTIHGRVTVKQVDPLPMTVLAMYPKGVSGE